MGRFTEFKRQAFEANVALPRHSLIDLTFGNADALDRAGAVFAIKPSGVDYASLSAEDMVVVDLDRRKSGRSSIPHRTRQRAASFSHSGHRRRRPHALFACDRFRPGRPANPDLRPHPR